MTIEKFARFVAPATIFCIAALLGCGLGENAGLGVSKEGGKPNVLIIFTDEWRAQALSSSGDPNVRTPNLDQLAAGGVRFERSYATNPACSPARAAFQTGRYPHQTGVTSNDVALTETQDSLAHSFAKAGYATSYIGKWHLDGFAQPGFVEPGRRQGYQHFEGFNRGHYHDVERKSGEFQSKYFNNKGELIFPGQYEPTYQVDLAMNFMRQQRAEPFLLFLSLGPPHSPFRAPEAFDRFTPDQLTWRKNVPERSYAKYAEELCGYYGLIESLDHEIGRLLDFLKSESLAENTVVFFSSDHGFGHGSHRLRSKSQPEEESIGIPLIVRGPGIASGFVSRTLVSQIDFAPTLLSAAGIDIPKAMVGRDFSDSLAGEDQQIPWVYIEGKMNKNIKDKETTDKGRQNRMISSAWRALVTDRHKIVIDRLGHVRLFVDLKKDPYEMDNRVQDYKTRRLRQDLVAQMREIARETGDSFFD